MVVLEGLFSSEMTGTIILDYSMIGVFDSVSGEGIVYEKGLEKTDNRVHVCSYMNYEDD